MASRDLQISASKYDAQEEVDDSDFAATGTVLGPKRGNSERRLAGFIFNSFPVPQGSTILTATMEGYVDNTNDNDPNSFVVHCEDVDNAADFTADDDLANRVLTSTIAAVGTQTVNTGWRFLTDLGNAIDIVPILQSVIDRDGWAKGNNLHIIWKGVFHVSDTHEGYEVRAWDFSGNAHGAKLHITWSENATRSFAKVMA